MDTLPEEIVAIVFGDSAATYWRGMQVCRGVRDILRKWLPKFAAVRKFVKEICVEIEGGKSTYQKLPNGNHNGLCVSTQFQFTWTSFWLNGEILFMSRKWTEMDDAGNEKTRFHCSKMNSSWHQGVEEGSIVITRNGITFTRISDYWIIAREMVPDIYCYEKELSGGGYEITIMEDQDDDSIREHVEYHATSIIFNLDHYREEFSKKIKAANL